MVRGWAVRVVLVVELEFVEDALLGFLFLELVFFELEGIG